MESRQFFPPLTPDLYALPAENSPFLQLATTRLSPLKMALGTGLTPIGQLTRLMMFHKKAFLAELAGEWKRADFYFDKCHQLLKEVSGEEDAWGQFKQKFRLDGDIGQLKQQTISEIFIETHLAFFRSSEKDENLPEAERQRSFYHLECAYLLAVHFQDLIQDEIVLDIYAQLFRRLYGRGEKNRVLKLIQQGKSGKRFNAFLTASERDIVFTSALEELTPKDANKNVDILKKAASHINLMHPELPDDLEWYNQLGLLYVRLAVQQANAGNLSDALLSVEKAGVYNPDLPGLPQLKIQLNDMMANLQAQMARVKRQLSYNQHLTGEGQRLMNEANRGFKPVEQFLNSEQPQDILSARKRATFNTSHSFLQREKPVTILFSSSMPALPVKATGKQKADTPLIFWLFSSKGWLAKTAAIAAVVVLGLTIFYTVRENQRLDRRNYYYSAIQQAIQQGKPFADLSGQVARFMNNRPAFGADQRTGQILDWYEKAFTNWFLQAENIDTPEAEKELRLFTSLTK